MTAGKTATGPMATSPSTSPNGRSRSTTTSATCSPNIPSISFEEAEMGHCYHHALSSVKKWGGTAEDYLPLHQWLNVIWTRKPFLPLFGDRWATGDARRPDLPSSTVMFFSSVGGPFLRSLIPALLASPQAAWLPRYKPG